MAQSYVLCFITSTTWGCHLKSRSSQTLHLPVPWTWNSQPPARYQTDGCCWQTTMFLAFLLYQPKLTSSYFSYLIGHHTPATVAFLSVLKITMSLLALRPSHSLCYMLKFAHIPPSLKPLLILQTSAPTSLPQGSLPSPLPQQVRAPWFRRSWHSKLLFHSIASIRIISLFV